MTQTVVYGHAKTVLILRLAWWTCNTDVTTTMTAVGYPNHSSWLPLATIDLHITVTIFFSLTLYIKV